MTAEASQAGAFEGPAADGERPLRIALLTYKGNPFCGGQGVYTRHLSRELARLGHRVEVIGSQPYPVLDPGYDGLSLTELPSLDLYRSPDPFRTPKRDEYRDWIDALEVATMWTGGFPEPLTFSLRARRHLRARSGEFDVIHDNQTLGYGLLGDVGAPLVTTIHHPITVDRQLELDAAEGRWQRLSKRRWYAFTRMQKRVARRVPSVLTVSGTSRQEIIEHLGVRDDRIHVVHIGADTDQFSPDPSVRVVPGRIVTTSSADVPLKGLVFLVEALAKVRTEHPGAHLIVVGKRPAEGPVAQAMERYGLEGAVDFVKGITDAELVDLVRSAEVACVPSLYEGFSLPAAEAMATGTPLVATTGGAIPEVAGREAFTTAALVLGATEKLVVGYPGRYVLGLGVSGAVRESGVGPLPFLRDYLDELDELDELDATITRRGTTHVPRVLGGYSPRITRLAAERTDGLIAVPPSRNSTCWSRLGRRVPVWSRTCGWRASRSPEVRLRSTRPDLPAVRDQYDAGATQVAVSLVGPLDEAKLDAYRALGKEI